MAGEDNKSLVRRLFDETWTKGNVNIADELIAANYVNHDPALPPGAPQGREGFKQAVALYRKAFPDLKLTIDEQAADGDRVVTRWTARGTHGGELFGIPPTGKMATTTGITFSRVSGGQVMEDWTNWDTLGLMQQLGAVQPLGQAQMAR